MGSLALPFWSILLLLRCKVWLDEWLQHTLDQLQELRREIVSQTGPSPVTHTKEERIAAEQEQTVSRLGGFIVEYQDLFADLWAHHCANLLHLATRLLWSSVWVSIVLVSFMMWLFLVNRKGEQNVAHWHFMLLTFVGLLVPLAVYPLMKGQRAAVPARTMAPLGNFSNPLPPTAPRRSSSIQSSNANTPVNDPLSPTAPRRSSSLTPPRRLSSLAPVTLPLERQLSKSS